MNLVIALLSTRTFITADRIRETVFGYSEGASDEAFSRMFERDKNELRDLGIPLETGRVSPTDPTEGYRISREAYALPGLRGSEEVLGILLSAIDSGHAVQFPHRPSRTDPYVTRTVEPWGVVTDRGRWYLVGHDRDRDAVRTFRLSRIGAEVTPIGEPGAVSRPAGLNLREIVDRVVGDWPAAGQANVWVADGRATALRRRATIVGPRELGGRPGEEIALDIDMFDRVAREIASYGADAVVLAPEPLREDVIARLEAQAGEWADRA